MSKTTATPPAAARPATGKVKPLRIDAELDREIKRVAKIIGLNDADTSAAVSSGPPASSLRRFHFAHVRCEFGDHRLPMRKALERGLPMVEALLKPAYKKAA